MLSGFPDSIIITDSPKTRSSCLLNRIKRFAKFFRINSAEEKLRKKTLIDKQLSEQNLSSKVHVPAVEPWSIRFH